MRSFFRTGAYSRITAQYHHLNEYRRGGDLLKQPPHEANIAEQTDHTIDGGSLAFDLSSADRSDRFNAYFSFQNTARKSYYGSNAALDVRRAIWSWLRGCSTCTPSNGCCSCLRS